MPLLDVTYPAGTFTDESRTALVEGLSARLLRAEGALPDERKAKFIAEATSVISEAAGLSQGDGLRVWVLINEVPEGSWGAGGEVVRFEQLRQIAQGERETVGAA
jgi:phenylpyruvate tautomerase PptA (4-oxalocrotonate tautomerase family)